VPDWTGCEYGTASLIGLDFMEEKERPNFNSTKGSNTGQSLQHTDNVLHLSGYTVDSIQSLSVTFTAPKSDLGDFQRTMGSFRGSRNYLSNMFETQRSVLELFLQWEKLALADEHQKYPTGEDPLRVYCWTLCAATFLEGADQAFEQFTRWRSGLRGPRALNKIKLNKIRPLYKVASPLTSLAFSDVHGYDMRFSISMLPSGNRRLARSSKGYLALVPAESRVGDPFVLLRGGKVPYVCRPKNSEWELIGDSYVHGIMQGEAWEDAKCEPFNLC
jgi:hypothetical protein